MNNSLYLRRRRKVFVERGCGELPENYIAALLKNLESLDWALSPELTERLRTLSLDELTAFYEELIPTLRALVGAHREFRPMYPNFPRQVMEMSEARLYLNAILHYWTNALPAYTKRERLPLADEVELKAVALGDKADFEAIFTALIAAKGSLSAQDKEDVAWFVKSYGDDIWRLIPAEIAARETVALLGALLIAHTSRAEELLRTHVKTATDVLRLAVALSGGDISLAQPVKFAAFKRSARRFLLALLEECPNLLEDMRRWPGRWIRLGEKLHPGEFKARFPRAFEAFQAHRNKAPLSTFNSQIEKALEVRDAAGVQTLLRARPGDFARRLDFALRQNSDAALELLSAFESVAARVSTPVLLQMMAHFKHREGIGDFRAFFPKGDVGKVFALEKGLPPIENQWCERIVQIAENTLRERFAQLAPLGRCFLDERLKNFPVPGAQRSASKSLRTLPRGSRLPLPDAKVIRFFLWWKNGRERTDIDLSAALYDAAFVYKDIVSYYNLKNYGGHHSGDIVDAPQGAAEFIDLDIARTLEMGVRYIVMSVNSFTDQPFCDLPECFAGWMGRQDANSGDIFEPKTVQDRVDLAADTRICLPLIIDLEAREVIWADLALRRFPSWNNVENNLKGVSLMLRAMTGLIAPTLHELFSLHIQARGELAAELNEAETVFAFDQGITPFDLDRIRSEFV